MCANRGDHSEMKFWKLNVHSEQWKEVLRRCNYFTIRKWSARLFIESSSGFVRFLAKIMKEENFILPWIYAVTVNDNNCCGCIHERLKLHFALPVLFRQIQVVRASIFAIQMHFERTNMWRHDVRHDRWCICISPNRSSVTRSNTSLPKV